jgi:hypothetical protein
MHTRFHRLPDDILREIFLLCVGDLRYVIPYETESLKLVLHWPVPQGVILSHVCSRWRHLTCLMRILWSSVCIVSFNTRSGRLASEWLSRAGGYPVTINIRDFDDYCDWDSDTFYPLTKPKALNFLAAR